MATNRARGRLTAAQRAQLGPAAAMFRPPSTRTASIPKARRRTSTSTSTRRKITRILGGGRGVRTRVLPPATRDPWGRARKRRGGEYSPVVVRYLTGGRPTGRKRGKR